MSYQALTDLSIFDGALGIAALTIALVVIGHSSSQSGARTCKTCGSNQQIVAFEPAATLTPPSDTNTITLNEYCDEQEDGKNKYRFVSAVTGGQEWYTSRVGTTVPAAGWDTITLVNCQRNDAYTDGLTKTCSGKNYDCNQEGIGLFSSSGS